MSRPRRSAVALEVMLWLIAGGAVVAASLAWRSLAARGTPAGPFDGLGEMVAVMIFGVVAVGAAALAGLLLVARRWRKGAVALRAGVGLACVVAGGWFLVAMTTEAWPMLRYAGEGLPPDVREVDRTRLVAHARREGRVTLAIGTAVGLPLAVAGVATVRTAFARRAPEAAG